MNKPLNIKQLKKYCEIQIKLGRGDYSIMISNDDEGNGYHYLWYPFCPAQDLLDEGMEIYELDEDIDKIEKTVLLG